MKKLRRTRFTDEDEAPSIPYRHHMPRKEFVALGGRYDHRPCKLTKGERAALRRLRRRRVAQAERYPEPRPRYDDPAWLALREAVLAVGYCAWCGTRRKLTVDHVVPLGRGGSSLRSNLQCLCVGCNKAKGDQLGLFSWPD